MALFPENYRKFDNVEDYDTPNTADATELEISRLFNKSIVQLGKEIEPLKIRNINIILDSVNTNRKPFNTNKFTWEFTYDGLVRKGVVTTNKKVYNFIGMRIFGVKLDVIDEFLASYSNKAFNSFKYNPYPILSLLIEEFKSQSFIAHEGTNFHFLGEITNTNIAQKIDLSFEKYNNGFYWFYKPIQELKTITISLSSPVAPMLWPDPAKVGVLDILGYPDFVRISNIDTTGFVIGQRVFIKQYAFVPPDTPLYNAIFSDEGVIITNIIGVGPGSKIIIDVFGFVTISGGIYVVNYNVNTIIPIELYFLDDDQNIEELEQLENKKYYDNFYTDEKVNISKLLSVYNSSMLYNNMIPDALYRKQYVFFDSNYCDFITKNKISWIYDAVQQRPNTVNTSILLKDIIGVKIYKIQFYNFYDQLITRPIQKIYTAIDELTSQSFINQEQRYHFVFDKNNKIIPYNGGEISEYDQKWNNWGEFKYNDPILIRDRMTLSFYSQSVNSQIVPYNIELSIPGNLSLAQYSTGFIDITTTRSIPFPVFTILNYTMFITGFTTSDPLNDAAFINYINRKEGHPNPQLLIKIPGFCFIEFLMTGDNEWDFAGIPILGTPVNTNTRVSFTYNRIFIAMEFTYKKSTPGYYIDDVADVSTTKE